jgi:hypothetical protein
VRFRDSCLYEVLRYPVKCYHAGVYGFIIRIPYLICFLVVGIILAVLADLCLSPDIEI